MLKRNYTGLDPPADFGMLKPDPDINKTVNVTFQVFEAKQSEIRVLPGTSPAPEGSNLDGYKILPTATTFYPIVKSEQVLKEWKTDKEGTFHLQYRYRDGFIRDSSFFKDGTISTAIRNTEGDIETITSKFDGTTIVKT